MNLRLRQSVDTLNKLFAETADLSGSLTQFPHLHSTRTQIQEDLRQTLGIIQMICRVILEEQGEIKPLPDDFVLRKYSPQGEMMNRVLERNPSTGQPCIIIDADRVSPDLPPAEYLRLLHRWTDLVLPSRGRFTPPDGHNFDCRRLNVDRAVLTVEAEDDLERARR